LTIKFSQPKNQQNAMKTLVRIIQDAKYPMSGSEVENSTMTLVPLNYIYVRISCLFNVFLFLLFCRPLFVQTAVPFGFVWSFWSSINLLYSLKTCTEENKSDD
jgi:hypothetical protein